MEPRMQNAATAPVLVTGGTGTLGRLVSARLVAEGRRVRSLSRGKRAGEPGRGIEYVNGDLSTGEGIDAALEGIEIIVHCAGTQKGDDVKARHLVRAAQRSGARHIVYISVVGDELVPQTGRLDRAMFGYFGSKLGAERVIAGSGIPWTTLHATQFHDLVLTTVSAMARLPVVPVPGGTRFQPIDASEVADRLVELALGEPAGRVPDLAGPTVYQLADLVRSYLRATGKRRLLVPVRMPGRAAAAIRSGVQLAPDRAVGRITWEEFLAAHVDAPVPNGERRVAGR